MWRQSIIALIFLFLLVFTAQAKPKLFVASSVADVTEALIAAAQLDDVDLVVGSSSSLARQIKAGAPAALFISAHAQWADFAADGAPLYPLFSNRLVLISAVPQQIDDFSSLTAMLHGQRLAIADPDHVPAGLYAKQALEHAGVWDDLETQLAPAKNVRLAARLVAFGAAPFGIVYASDAKGLNLNIAHLFPRASHEKIVYWAVDFDAQSETAQTFMRFVGTHKARAIIAQYGFLPLEDLE